MLSAPPPPPPSSLDWGSHLLWQAVEGRAARVEATRPTSSAPTALPSSSTVPPLLPLTHIPPLAHLPLAAPLPALLSRGQGRQVEGGVVGRRGRPCHAVDVVRQGGGGGKQVGGHAGLRVVLRAVRHHRVGTELLADLVKREADSKYIVFIKCRTN